MDFLQHLVETPSCFSWSITIFWSLKDAKDTLHFKASNAPNCLNGLLEDVGSMAISFPAPSSLLLETTGNFASHFSSLFFVLKIFLPRGELLLWWQQILNAWFPCAWLQCNYDCSLSKVRRTYSFFSGDLTNAVSSGSCELSSAWGRKGLFSGFRAQKWLLHSQHGHRHTYPTMWSQLPSPFFPCHSWQGCAHILLSPCLFHAFSHKCPRL